MNLGLYLAVELIKEALIQQGALERYQLLPFTTRNELTNFALSLVPAWVNEQGAVSSSKARDTSRFVLVCPHSEATWTQDLWGDVVCTLCDPPKHLGSAYYQLAQTVAKATEIVLDGRDPKDIWRTVAKDQPEANQY